MTTVKAIRVGVGVYKNSINSPVIVAQLAEQATLIQEDPGSNPAIRKIYLFSVVSRDKTKKM